MSSTALRSLAIGLIAVAGLLALYAFRIGSNEPTPAPAAPVAETAAPEPELAAEAVVTLRAIEPGTLLNREVIGVRPVVALPEQGFVSIEEVLGRVTVVALAKGEPLAPQHFREPGPLAQALLPKERAVAVKIDGVIGLGGFAQPGDRVDVILFLSSNSRDVPESQAQLLLEDVRILAYGTRIASDPEGKPTTDARTAVLAVPSESVSRLMLGASAGSLRLALRGDGGATPAAGSPKEPVKLKALVASARRGGGPAPAAAEIIRGTKREWVRP